MSGLTNILNCFRNLVINAKLLFLLFIYGLVYLLKFAVNIIFDHLKLGTSWWAARKLLIHQKRWPLLPHPWYLNEEKTWGKKPQFVTCHVVVQPQLMTIIAGSAGLIQKYMEEKNKPPTLHPTAARYESNDKKKIFKNLEAA